MRQDDNENIVANSASSEGDALAVKAKSRRKFVAQAAAAPVLLTVSGRSALACGTYTDKGHSLVTWCSIHPKGKGGTSACVSHTVSSGNVTGCHHPNTWTPKPKTSNCFSVKWPTACKPWGAYGESCWGKNIYGQYVQRTFDPTRTYGYMCRDYTEGSGTCAGWKTGHKLTWLDSSKSVSEILLGEAGTLKAFVCAAHLNACARAEGKNNYVLTVAEVQTLYQGGKVNGIALPNRDDLCAFLQNTMV